MIRLLPLSILLVLLTLITTTQPHNQYLPLITKPQPPPIPTLPPAAPPRLTTTTIHIPTYQYEAGFLPTTPDDPIYPYPRLNHDAVQPPTTRSYHALIVENDFVTITIVPALGGRLYRWVDKATGRQLLYENPVIKPTRWGYRGWWLAMGGMEWTFPTEDHGLNEWRPWSYHVDQQADFIAVTVSDMESRTGMMVGSTMTLYAQHSYIQLEPWAINFTDRTQPYQLWVNGMLTLGENRVGRVAFLLPTTEVVVHSTGDVGLPPAGGRMAWPLYHGRDFSQYQQWRNHLGFFIPQHDHPFTALYDHDTGQGVVRAWGEDGPIGTKIFGPAGLASWLWTDDESNYVELWSGATGDFGQYAWLAPSERVSWTEYWYPVQGVAALQVANEAGVLGWVMRDGEVWVSTAVSTPTIAHLILWQGDQRLTSWDVTLRPGELFQAGWPSAGLLENGLRLELVDAFTGQLILRTE